MQDAGTAMLKETQDVGKQINGAKPCDCIKQKRKASQGDGEKLCGCPGPSLRGDGAKPVDCFMFRTE
jgi:hypothetical protein